MVFLKHISIHTREFWKDVYQGKNGIQKMMSEKWVLEYQGIYIYTVYVYE